WIFVIWGEIGAPLRLMEAEALAHGFERLGRGVATGDAGGGIGARCHEEDEEHQHADAEHHKGHLAEAAKQGEQHQSPPSLILERGSSASRSPSPSTLRTSTV